MKSKQGITNREFKLLIKPQGLDRRSRITALSEQILKFCKKSKVDFFHLDNATTGLRNIYFYDTPGEDFRRNNIISAYEYLEDRFGPSVRIYGAVTFFIGQLVRISLILYLLSLMVNEVTNLSVIQSILLAGFIVGLYTIIGGIEAVIWTDVIQTFTLLSGGVICLVVIIHQLPGGLSQIMDVAIANNKLTFSELKNGILQPVSWGISLADKTGIMMLLLGLSWFFQEYVTNQNMIQRYAVAKNVQEARKAMYISSINIPIWAFFMFLGTAL